MSTHIASTPSVQRTFLPSAIARAVYAMGTSTIGILRRPSLAVTSGQNSKPVHCRSSSRRSLVSNSLKQVASSVIDRPNRRLAVVDRIRLATKLAVAIPVGRGLARNREP